MRAELNGSGSAWSRSVGVTTPAQVQWQMFVCGTIRTHVAVLTSRLEFREYVVEYTNAATIVNEEFKGPEDLGGFFDAIGAGLTKNEFVVGNKAKDGNDYLVFNQKKGTVAYDDGGAGGSAVNVTVIVGFASPYAAAGRASPRAERTHG